MGQNSNKTRSSRAGVKFMDPVHKWLSDRSEAYRQWHEQPHHKVAHWTVLVVGLLILGMLLWNVVPTRAANFVHAWPSDTAFNGDGTTLSDVEVSGGDLQLTQTSTTFTETFDDTTYKDDSTNANWGGGMVKLGGGVDTVNNYTTEFTDLIGTSTKPMGASYDSVDNKLYWFDNQYGTSGNYGFWVYNFSDGTFTDLTSQVSSNVMAIEVDEARRKVYLGDRYGDILSYDINSNTTSTLAAMPDNIKTGMEYDSNTNKIYVNNYHGACVVDVTNGSYDCDSRMTSRDMYSIAYDSDNNDLYVAGSYRLFYKWDLDTGTKTDLSSVFDSFWASSAYFDAINHMKYKDGKVYVTGLEAGAGANLSRFAIYDVNSGSVTDKTAVLPAEYYGAMDLQLDSVNNRLYMPFRFLNNSSYGFGYYDISGDSFVNKYSVMPSYTYDTNYTTFMNGGDFKNGIYYGIGAASGASMMYTYGSSYSSSSEAISTAIDDTATNIGTATLTATETVPENTTVTYYMSANGGSNWEEVTSGQLHTFANTGSDLKFKIAMTTSDGTVTPEVSNVQIDYSYYTSSGTWEAQYDAGQAVAWYLSEWTATEPANTNLSFEYATSDDGVTWSDWSSSTDASTGSVRLDSAGLDFTDSQYIKVRATFTNSASATPVLDNIDVQYVINAAPEIQNMTASQNTDGTKTVTVAYESRDTDTTNNPYNPNQATVSLEYSVDNGETWNDCINTTGTGLQSISNAFTAKTATWDMALDLNDEYVVDQVKMRLVVDDNELAHNTDTVVSEAFTIDTVTPTADSLLIEGGDEANTWTNNPDVTLLIAATDTPSFVSGSVGEMMISQSADFSGASWETYNTTKDWTLTGEDGTKSVFIKFRDAFGNTSSTLSDTIVLDTTAPDTPLNVTVHDTSNLSTGEYSLAVLWSGIPEVDDFDSYVVERKEGEDGEWVEVDTTTQAGYINSGLSSDVDYYYRVSARDIHGNDSAASVAVNYQPASADIVEPVITFDQGGTPNVIVAENTATITWTTDEASDSYVEYGTTTNYGNIQGTATNVTSHSVSLVGLDANTLYHFRIRSQDPAGNLATSSDYTFTTTTGEPIAIEEESEAQTPGAGSEEVTVMWTTNKYSTSQVLYGLSADNLNLSTEEDATLNLSHSVKITELNPGTTYYYQPRSVDAYGNEILGTIKTFETASVDTEAPVIDEDSFEVSVDAVSATDVTALIYWETDEASTSQVEWGTSPGSYTYTSNLNPAFDTFHYLRIGDDLEEPLQQGQTYYYRVTSEDASGNSSTSEEHSFETIVYPTISSDIATANVTNDSAQIDWATNTDSNSYVKYGTELDDEGQILDAQIQGNDTQTTEHSVTLTGLSADQSYYYEVVSENPYGDKVISSQGDFTTARTSVPIESGIGNLNASPSGVAQDVSTTDVVITWYTAFEGSSFVEYGLTESYGSEEGTSELVNSHTVTLTNLSANTTYHYRVKSVDKDGNIFTSVDNTFTTTAVVEASISEISITDISLNQATINWKTSRAATSQIEYGLTPGNLDQLTPEADLNGNTNHKVTLTDLEAGKTYYFRIRSKEIVEGGDLLVSPPYAFSTVAIPEIINLSAASVDSNTVKVSWSTNVDTKCSVEYSISDDFLDSLEKSAGDFATNFEVELQKLSAATTYYYRVIAADKYGNLTTSQTSTFTTSADNKAPVITNVKSEISTVGSGEAARTQMIVSWNTDEPATSFVDYGEGIGKEDVSYSNTVPNLKEIDPETLTYNQSHVVVIQNLKDSTSYHFRVRSNDETGNESASEDYTVLTPKKQKSVLQVIIDTLETQFGWITDIAGSFSNQ